MTDLQSQKRNKEIFKIKKYLKRSTECFAISFNDYLIRETAISSITNSKTIKLTRTLTLEINSGAENYNRARGVTRVTDSRTT